VKEFEIKQEHITLLQHAYIGWNDCDYGAPSIDPKRPYGNSCVEENIAEILGWTVGEELSEEQRELAYKLHQETKTALQICITLQKFETGFYEKTEEYNSCSWKKVVKYLGETVVEDLKNTPFANFKKSDWAMYFVEHYGQIDGDHHKSWVLDQVSRILKDTPIIVKIAKWSDGKTKYRVQTGEASLTYKFWIENMKGDDYTYNEGIAP